MKTLSIESLVAQLEDDDLICNLNNHNPPSYYLKNSGTIYYIRFNRGSPRLEQMSEPVVLQKVSSIDPNLFNGQKWVPYKTLRGSK